MRKQFACFILFGWMVFSLVGFENAKAGGTQSCCVAGPSVGRQEVDAAEGVPLIANGSAVCPFCDGLIEAMQENVRRIAGGHSFHERCANHVIEHRQDERRSGVRPLDRLVLDTLSLHEAFEESKFALSEDKFR